MPHSIELFACQITATDLVRLETLYLPGLHTGEQRRYRQLMTARRRLEWLAGRALALESLPLVLGRINKHALHTGSNGNIVYQAACVHLSLSHSRGLLVLVIADVPTGVDVERVRARLKTTHVAREFAPEEAAHLSQMRGAERLRLFYQYWTLKEAACKAAGLSIWEGLAAARFDLRSPPGLAFTGSTERLQGTWRFWSAGINAHWQLAVAVRAVLPAQAFTAWQMSLSGSRKKLELDAPGSFAST